ncbi:MAG: hypothetical protein KGQ59_04900 [Bdellovibrionales bacterium]|nr:hypothetical protein [Bdellovibrionales bacterium]
MDLVKPRAIGKLAFIRRKIYALPMDRLTPETYQKGFLIDEELLGGVSLIEGAYVAFVLRHTTGEYLGTQTHPTLEEALRTINAVQRKWAYESSSQCGGGACAEGNCGTGSCKKVLSKSGACCD